MESCEFLGGQLMPRPNKEFEPHITLMGARASVHRAATDGAVILTPPLKFVDGSGSPLRVLAFVPANS